MVFLVQRAKAGARRPSCVVEELSTQSTSVCNELLISGWPPSSDVRSLEDGPFLFAGWPKKGQDAFIRIFHDPSYMGLTLNTQ